MSKSEATALLIDTICDYVHGYAEDGRDVSRLTGEESGHRPDRDNVAALAEALRALGRDRTADRLEILAKRRTL